MAVTTFAEAVREAGGATKFAERHNISRRTVFNWLSDGVPAERVSEVAEWTGVPPANLRPDLAKLFRCERECA